MDVDLPPESVRVARAIRDEMAWLRTNLQYAAKLSLDLKNSVNANDDFSDADLCAFKELRNALDLISESNELLRKYD